MSGSVELLAVHQNRRGCFGDGGRCIGSLRTLVVALVSERMAFAGWAFLSFGDAVVDDDQDVCGSDSRPCVPCPHVNLVLWNSRFGSSRRRALLACPCVPELVFLGGCTQRILCLFWVGGTISSTCETRNRILDISTYEEFPRFGVLRPSPTATHCQPHFGT